MGVSKKEIKELQKKMNEFKIGAKVTMDGEIGKITAEGEVTWEDGYREHGWCWGAFLANDGKIIK